MGKNENINIIEYPLNPNKIYKNTNGESFIIQDAKTESRITSNGNKRWDKYYLAVFTKTGYQKWSQHRDISRGSIKDWLSPNVCGVGIVGVEIVKPQSHYLYDRWRDMIRRCYDVSSSGYSTYGAVGCTVCEEWKYFPNFVRDIEAKENADKLKQKHKNPNDRYEIDKDLIKSGNKIYCNEYVSIVPHLVNVEERNLRHNYNKDKTQTPIFRITKDFEEFVRFNSITEALKSVDGKHASSISGVCRGDFNSYKGYYWHYDNATKEEMINNIKKRINK